MFKNSVVIMLVFAFQIFQTPAFAEPEKTVMEFSLISTKDTMNAEKKIPVSSIKKGVFVTVTSGWTPYPKTAAIVKEMLAAKGIKVVDVTNEADYGLQFRSDFSDLSEIEDNEDAGINKERAVAVVASAIFTGGASLIGEMWHPSNQGKQYKTNLGVGITTTPEVSGRGTLSGSDLVFVVSEYVYQTNTKGHEATKAAFITGVANFIEKHFVFDTVVNDPEKLGLNNVGAEPAAVNAPPGAAIGGAIGGMLGQR